MENDTEKGNRYALAALKKQRADMAGEIACLSSKILWLKSQLGHVDATLRLLDPSIDLKGLPVSRPRKRIKLFRQGELGRLIVDALRRAGKPVGTHEVVTAVLAAGGHGESARAALAPRVRGNLAYLEKAGKVVKQGHGKEVHWGIQIPA